VLISGMHVQRGRIQELIRRAHAKGKLVALGGPSVSAAPEFYPEADFLHCGEVGDATLRLFQHLDASVSRRATQEILRTTQRLSLTDFPCPAYKLAELNRYMLGSVQFSSGCPYTCEFCDIPGLYGRNPRVKTPGQILVELDELLAGGVVAVYFVDDNFIAKPKATQELLPHLVQWQAAHSYPFHFACEATLNLASHPRVLALMREAFFVTVFCGIETPEPAALRAMRKTQNLRTPILDSVATLNRYGLEVASGIIMGLDTDTAETPDAIIEFANQSHIPLLTVNLLYALPHTPLYERLQREGRIVPESDRDSNIEFAVPYQTVVDRWSRVISKIYEPGSLYSRFAAQALETYPNRKQDIPKSNQLTWANLKRLMWIAPRLLWHVGIRSDYRRHFWTLVREQVRRGDIETIFRVAVVAHHLITYSRECSNGAMQSSNYSQRAVEECADA
jgi:hopanoid C-2 methylase